MKMYGAEIPEDIKHLEYMAEGLLFIVKQLT